MSRIGKAPISIPAGVSCDVQGSQVTVKGPKGTLSMELRPEVQVVVEGKHARVERTGTGGERQARAYHGMTRAILSNLVEGAHQGYTRELEIVGVGWTAKAQGAKLTLNIGFCHPVDIDMPQGVAVETPRPTQIILTGCDKHLIGQVAANVRKVRPPEPYKGKGIRYKGEFVRRKSGKSFGS